MKRRLRALAAASTAVVALSGCGLLGNGTATGADRPAVATAAGDLPTPAGDLPTPAASPASAAGELGTAAHRRDLPDPCTLLSRAEVAGLTGRSISEVDRDDAQPGDSTRYCQWQQDSGQLALFLSRTTEDEFDTGVSGAQPVDAVAGHRAFNLAGHLYVLAGAVQVDVYSRGGTDQQNLAEEARVVKAVLPRIEST